MVIDADIHVTLDTIDNLRPYLPERYRQRTRFLNQDEYDRDLGGTLGKRGVTAAQHLQDMDQEGIDVQVLFPTTLLNFGSLREPDLAAALARAYNDWLHAFCQAEPRRFKGVALVALQDIPQAIEELTRAVTQLGMVAVMVPSYVYPGKDLGSREFDPFYAAVEQLGIPVAVHRVSGSGSVGFERFTNFTALHTVVPMFELATAVVNMVVGGVFERFPRLKVAYLEAGVGWLPWLVENLDEHCEVRAREVPHLKARPSEYLRSGRVYFSFEPGEGGVAAAAEVVGEQALLFSSDYPHWDSPFPHSVRLVRERRDLSERLKERVLTLNPAACYGLPTQVPA
ncbi:MAG TPA: amidohydrolase family protein [Chloroflexota bacterium]|nr:amidohydrolase family protein [Chloroflexota bacterium]